MINMRSMSRKEKKCNRKRKIWEKQVNKFSALDIFLNLELAVYFTLCDDVQVLERNGNWNWKIEIKCSKPETHWQWIACAVLTFHSQTNSIYFYFYSTGKRIGFSR
jgi:hypothetical protein